MLKDEAACVVTSQIIDEELESLSRQELEGCWRSLCAMMLLRTANLLTCQMLSRKDFAAQRQEAIRWISADSGGVISFRTACDSLDMDFDLVREGMFRHAESRMKWPINKAGTPRHVFGKLHEPATKDQSPAGMVARHQLHHRSLVGAAG